MPEKTARWTTMLDGIPNVDSGGTEFLGGTQMKVHRAVAGAWILMACAGLAGCSSADGRLPPAVTTEVARDFNEGDALRTAADYTDDAQILAPQHPAVQGKAAIVAFFKANIDK